MIKLTEKFEDKKRTTFKDVKVGEVFYYQGNSSLPKFYYMKITDCYVDPLHNLDAGRIVNCVNLLNNGWSTRNLSKIEDDKFVTLVDVELVVTKRD